MSEGLATCVNHPDAETRLSCSSCGAPICTRCMRQSAVGQKCPRCARPAGRTRAVGRPVHYVRAVGAGVAAGGVGGVALVLVVGRIGFGRILLSMLVGFLVGKAVRWGSRGQTQAPWPHIAVGCAVVGILAPAVVLFGTLRLSAWSLLALAAAGWFAVRGLHS